MVECENKKVIEREQLLTLILKIIKDLTSNWEMEFDNSFDADSYLGADVGFQSIDLVRLISEIQQNFIQKPIPFEELFFNEGTIITDIQVSQLVDFLIKRLNNFNAG